MEEDKEKHIIKTEQKLMVEPNNNLQKMLIIAPKNSGLQLKKETFKVNPSTALDRVKNFLPELINANKELSAMELMDQKKLDIENVEDCDKVIEMNVSIVDNNVLLSDDDTTDESSDSSDEDELELDDKKVGINKPIFVHEVSTTTVEKGKT